jgi:hypothetical protein
MANLCSKDYFMVVMQFDVKIDWIISFVKWTQSVNCFEISRKNEVVMIVVVASKTDRKVHKKVNDLRRIERYCVSEAVRLNEKFRVVLGTIHKTSQVLIHFLSFDLSDVCSQLWSLDYFVVVVQFDIQIDWIVSFVKWMWQMKCWDCNSFTSWNLKWELLSSMWMTHIIDIWIRVEIVTNRNIWSR